MDVVNALTFVNKNIAAFGGDNSRVTVAGESSGGTMIRTLLAVPSASHLFRSAIIQSDPMVGLIAFCMRFTFLKFSIGLRIPESWRPTNLAKHVQ